MATSRKKKLGNSIELEYQKSLMQLMSRYCSTINVPGTLLLQHSWIIKFLSTGNINSEVAEFVCRTSNPVFAAVIFEADVLPEKILIHSITYNGVFYDS